MRYAAAEKCRKCPAHAGQPLAPSMVRLPELEHNTLGLGGRGRRGGYQSPILVFIVTIPAACQYFILWN
jgi:hypothetical protein